MRAQQCRSWTNERAGYTSNYPGKLGNIKTKHLCSKRKLVPWLRVILRNQTVLETMYQPWSYSVTTGFDDTFKLLERLSVYVFDLPVDIAVKQFEELEEAF